MQALQEGKRVLAEGAQGSMLDIDFGTYPYVTSSNTISAGVCNGLGIAPNKIGEVIGITKAYCTRVGSGPFPTELHGEVGEFLRQEGSEFCDWFGSEIRGLECTYPPLGVDNGKGQNGRKKCQYHLPKEKICGEQEVSQTVRYQHTAR